MVVSGPRGFHSAGGRGGIRTAASILSCQGPKTKSFPVEEEHGNTDFILSRHGGAGGLSILPCPACLSPGQGPGCRCCTGASCRVVGIINNQTVSLRCSTASLKTLGVISRSWEPLSAIISILVNILNAMFCISLKHLRAVYYLYLHRQTFLLLATSLKLNFENTYRELSKAYPCNQ